MYVRTKYEHIVCQLYALNHMWLREHEVGHERQLYVRTYVRTCLYVAIAIVNGYYAHIPH